LSSISAHCYYIVDFSPGIVPEHPPSNITGELRNSHFRLFHYALWWDFRCAIDDGMIVKMDMKAVRENQHLKIESECGILRMLIYHNNLCSISKIQTLELYM